MISALAAAAISATPYPGALVCTFKSVQVGYLTPEYERSRAGDTLNLTFAGLSSKATSAQMIGNAGSSTVVVSRAAGQIQFAERTPIGNVTMTSVFATVSGKAMPAVHSRHILVAPGDVVISQYAGICEPR